MSWSRLIANLRLPVIGSPLFIISNPDLVIAQCQAGVIGAFPALRAAARAARHLAHAHPPRSWRPTTRPTPTRRRRRSR